MNRARAASRRAEATATPICRGASFDRTRRYRYRLTRLWDAARPTLGVIMLNPSTADARRDDPTIRRCMGLARAWGYGGIEVVNLFAWRTRTPAALRRVADPVGRRNDAWLRRLARRGADVLFAWGAHGALRGRDAAVLNLLDAVRGGGAAAPQATAHSAVAPVDAVRGGRAAARRRRRRLCLGLTKCGRPRHPLYVRADARPIDFEVSAVEAPPRPRDRGRGASVR